MSLKEVIATELEKAGAVRKPGSSNEWVMPQGFGSTKTEAGEGPTTSVAFIPAPPTAEKETPVAEGTVAADQLRLFIERIERLEEEKKGIADDVRDVYSEMKANGYDVATARRIVRLRKMESHHREEAAALLETYASALGLQGALPL